MSEEDLVPDRSETPVSLSILDSFVFNFENRTSIEVTSYLSDEDDAGGVATVARVVMSFYL